MKIKVKFKFKQKLARISRFSVYIGAKILCIQDLVMEDDNSIMAVKGKIYEIVETSRHDFEFIDELLQRHIIKYDDNPWFLKIVE